MNPDWGEVLVLTYMTLFSFQPPSVRGLSPCNRGVYQTVCPEHVHLHIHRPLASLPLHSLQGTGCLPSGDGECTLWVLLPGTGVGLSPSMMLC